MVDEFSSFARMPAPTMRDENLVELCHRAVFLQRSAYPRISFVEELPRYPVVRSCDGRQIGQAVTNILQNAVDAIEGRDAPVDGSLPQGKIVVRLLAGASGGAVVEVADNGRGLPQQGRERLTEPYVTTRTKGTGLGLAIVKKIMEDHGGDLVLDDNLGGGAVVRLVFVESSGREAAHGSSAIAAKSVAHGS